MNIEHLVENYNDRNKGDIIIARRLLVTMEAEKATLNREGADHREFLLERHSQAIFIISS
jgi:hypothetical protein